ncbi:SGNH/GDSL hydrolase family protein [Lentzea tibetensis]|uniref:SGNH/GDSL hydrolase family protein n=1 Tax=Lentzea tibetensis TaxID=2591470 RepID=A0A563EGU8_9PSEU|nr:SGNH/GDSL hydrolase family protein [Lentzea tibetensis]TWP45281.1 SGNH/GDSL hydrolase family protein [Lentzea tibetensis]
MRVLLVLALLLGFTTPAQSAPAWVAAWGSAVQTPVSPDVTGTAYTVRNVVRLTVGGSSVRLRLSNVFSSGDLTVGRVTVAPGNGAAATDTPRRVSFSGRTSVVVRRGAELLSDPVPLRVAADTSVLVSIYASKAPEVPTYHRSALQTNYVAAGDHARDVAGDAFTQKTGSWYYLSEVSVGGSPVRGSVVALGDSITDGSGSTGGAHRRWTDVLASRTPLGVVNSGISGNQLLRDGTYGVSGIARTPRDVLARAGVRTAIVLEGINDIKASPEATFEQLRTGYQQVIALAHQRGVRVLGATITPMGGYSGFTEKREAVRSAVNAWIRTSGEFDGVVDFDAAVRDPARPTWLLEPYARPDRLHLTDAGYEAMGRAVDLMLL